jgi:general secretion pathway protein L
MNYLAFDLGNYSIKIIEGWVSKKGVYSQKNKVVKVSQAREILALENADNLTVALSVVKSYLQDFPFTGKIIFALPANMMTTRYLLLPTSHKRKAEMMIPFQLDEELPFNSFESIFCSDVLPFGEASKALVSITQKSHFDPFYQQLKSLDIIPAQLTSEFALWQKFSELLKQQENQKNSDYKNQFSNGNFCVLDLGHESIKGYFFHDYIMSANHICHIGGKRLTQVIEHTYHISYEEAEIYKHQNAFALLPSYLQDLPDDQKELGSIIHRVLNPFLQDFRRWNLIHRMNHNESVSFIFLTGGASYIKNLDNYFSDLLSISCKRIDFNQIFDHSELRFQGIQKNIDCLDLSSLILNSKFSNRPLPHFLTGKYATEHAEHIPLHSSFFVFSRAIILLLFVWSGHLSIQYFLKNQEKNIDKKIQPILRSTELNLKANEKNFYRTDPKKILKIISMKKNSLDDEVSLLQSRSKESALDSLSKYFWIHQQQPLNITLELKGDSKQLFVKLQGERTSDLEKLKTLIEKQIAIWDVSDYQLDIQNDQKILSIDLKMNL